MYNDGRTSQDDSAGLADEAYSSNPSEEEFEGGANVYSEEDDGAEQPGLSSENEDFFDGLPYETEQDSSDDDRDYNLEDFVDPQFLQEAQGEEYETGTEEEGAAGGIEEIQGEDFDTDEVDEDVEGAFSASGDEGRTDLETGDEDEFDSASTESGSDAEETQVCLI